MRKCTVIYGWICTRLGPDLGLNFLLFLPPENWLSGPEQNLCRHKFRKTYLACSARSEPRKQFWPLVPHFFGPGNQAEMQTAFRVAHSLSLQTFSSPLRCLTRAKARRNLFLPLLYRPLFLHPEDKMRLHPPSAGPAVWQTSASRRAGAPLSDPRKKKRSEYGGPAGAWSQDFESRQSYNVDAYITC